MANPLFQSFGQHSSAVPNNAVSAFVQQFNEFKSALKVDPRKKVEELMANGVMSQAEFNQLSQIANQLIGILPK
jgi:hypothetical protein